jgi:hypothetical protein
MFLFCSLVKSVLLEMPQYGESRLGYVIVVSDRMMQRLSAGLQAQNVSVTFDRNGGTSGSKPLARVAASIMQ